VYGVNAVFILRKDCISWKKRLADAKNAVGPCQEELKLRVSGHTIDKRVACNGPSSAPIPDAGA